MLCPTWVTWLESELGAQLRVPLTCATAPHRQHISDERPLLLWSSVVCSIGFSLVNTDYFKGTFLILSFCELLRKKHEKDKTLRTTPYFHSETFFSPYKEKFGPNLCFCCHPSPQATGESHSLQMFTPTCPMIQTSHCGHADAAIASQPAPQGPFLSLASAQVGLDGKSAQLGKLEAPRLLPEGPQAAVFVKSILEPRLLVS